jgi:major membrane immunogen (membrane-anchored lipoprotein)
MTLKRFSLLLVVAAATAFVLMSCGGGGGKYEDGFYFAEQSDFGSSGWKYMVLMTVEDGKIVDVTWDGASVDGGTDKITRSEDGLYPMVQQGGAQSEWHVQAALVDHYLIETQDPAKLTYDENGNTDAISGVSIHINDFVELVNQALEYGPTERGPYRDGSYSAESDDFSSSGWKDRVNLTVIGGRIVAAYWNPYNEDGEDKYVASENGEYGMLQNGGAQAAWYEQADRVEAALLQSQDPAAFTWNEDGSTDAISGVSIHVNAFFELAAKALEGAK